MFKIVICDDDLAFMNRLQDLLFAHFSKHNCMIEIEKYNDGKTLIESIEKKKENYDVILLDIEMPSIDGFSVAEKLRKLGNDFILIFITSLENEAPRGYYYNAFRFILKKQLEKDVSEAVDTLISRIKDSSSENLEVTFKYKYMNEFDYVSVKRSDIYYFEVSDRRVFLRTVHGDYELLVKPLREYEKILNGNEFLIVNRSYLINLRYVKDIKGDYLLLTNNSSICMGYSKATKAAVRKEYMLYKSERI